MRNDKIKYEELIGSPILFELDKEKQSSRYRKESLRMVEYLYCYLIATNEEKNEPYGCEIVDVATRCINGFDGSGNFLHYFNAAWKNEFSHICGEEIISKKFHGMKITEQDKRNIKKYMRFLSRNSQFCTEEEKFEKIADLMNLSIEEVRNVAESSETQVIGEYTHNADGEEISTIEQMTSDFSIENYFDNLASMVEVLDSIENVYLDLQERQKPIVSDMLTCKIGLDIYEIEKISKYFTFISEEVGTIIKQTGKVPSQREIAEKYGKNEASISRTIKDFLIKVRKGEK